MIPTLRRLNDRERYWGMTWPGWCAAVGAGAVLYGAVKLSPFGVKPTVTIVLLLLAFGAMLVLGVSGQALSPGRHLRAIADYRRSPKRWVLPEQPDKHGLVLTSTPEPPHTEKLETTQAPEVLLAGELLDPRPRARGSVMAREPRAGSLAEVLPIALVEPDGLIITTDGRYVRLLECDRVPNTITADPADLARIGEAFAQLCRIIPDRQSLMVLAQTDPVAIDDALAVRPRGDAHRGATGPRRRQSRAGRRAGAVVRGDAADGDRGGGR